MRIDNLRQEREGSWTTVSARLTWEDNDRPEGQIRFQFGESLAADVECDPNAFLVAAAAPAAFYGERRLKIEGAVCPDLHDGILTALTFHREWFDKTRRLPIIEPTQGFSARTPRKPGRAAQFFSGGIDALATLRRNRLMYPLNHPDSIRDGLYVFGFHPYDFRDGEPSADRYAAWERNRGTMQNFAEQAGVEVHGLTTNILTLFNEENLFKLESHSSVLASLAHLIPNRCHRIAIAASDYAGDLQPWGSHPLIDPNYSSSRLQVIHDGTRLRRLDKVKLIADWPEALSTLNVCIRNVLPEDHMNCGTCPKCLRTMIELVICGALKNACTFPADDIDPAWIRAIHLRYVTEDAYWRECLEPLSEIGRHDLVAALTHLLKDYEARQRRKAGRGLKPKIKKLDDKLLGGVMRRTWNAWRQERV